MSKVGPRTEKIKIFVMAVDIRLFVISEIVL